jgi:hypothetical protein
VKRLMPDAEPFRAWATFSFTAASGRIHECDLLIAVPGGLYLLELKAHPGRVINHGDTWTFTERDSSRIRTLRNPLHFTDAKSKDLKGRLEPARPARCLDVVSLEAGGQRAASDRGVRVDLRGDRTVAARAWIAGARHGGALRRDHRPAGPQRCLPGRTRGAQ